MVFFPWHHNLKRNRPYFFCGRIYKSFRRTLLVPRLNHKPINWKKPSSMVIYIGESLMSYIFGYPCIVEMTLHQVHKVPGGNRGVIAVEDNEENTILKVWVFLDLELHVHSGSSLEKMHVYILFRDLIRETIDHVLFYSAERHRTGRSHLHTFLQ